MLKTKHNIELVLLQQNGVDRKKYSDESVADIEMFSTVPRSLYLTGIENPATEGHVLKLSERVNKEISIDAIVTAINLRSGEIPEPQSQTMSYLHVGFYYKRNGDYGWYHIGSLGSGSGQWERVDTTTAKGHDTHGYDFTYGQNLLDAEYEAVNNEEFQEKELIFYWAQEEEGEGSEFGDSTPVDYSVVTQPVEVYISIDLLG